MKPIIIIGAASGTSSIGGVLPRRWGVMVDLIEGSAYEWILHEILSGNVLHYDMSVFPEKGDALQHFDKGSAVIADHLYYCTQEDKPYFFYNRRNNDIVTFADEANVPLLIIGDYPERSRRPDEILNSSLRVYLPPRRIRSNPLVDWRQVGVPFASHEIERAARPLFTPSAASLYAEKLKTVPLNVYVLIGRPDAEGLARREAQTLMAKGHTVLWYCNSFEDLVGPERYQVLVKGKRGTPTHLAPMTPFVLLHRMFDNMRKHAAFRRDIEDIGFRFDQFASWEPLSVHERIRLYSSGVDTWAGRNGALASWQEATSDLWAKYLLTGRIAYEPKARPLSAPGGWSKEELDARLDYNKQIHRSFVSFVDFMKENGVLLSVSE